MHSNIFVLYFRQIKQEVFMPLQFEEMADGKVLETHLSGVLTEKDYEPLVHELEQLIERHGKIRMLAEMHDFHGWNARGLWEELKLDAKYFNHIERAAVVGEKKWQDWMSRLAQPFARGTLRYFEHNQIDRARSWLSSRPLMR
jgi:hypothetical protein